jgi:hypothetical protein
VCSISPTSNTPTSTLADKQSNARNEVPTRCDPAHGHKRPADGSRIAQRQEAPSGLYTRLKEEDTHW